MPRPGEFSRLAILCLVGGSADAIAYLRYGTFVGAMTGNTVLLGIDLTHGQFAQAGFHACTVAAFLGAAALAQTARISRIPAVVLLALTPILLMGSDLVRSEWSAVIDAAALGVQNAVVRSVAGISVNTVFITGNLLRLATAAPEAAQPRRQREVVILAAAWLIYAAGALLGAAAVGLMSYPMALPAALALLAAISLGPRQR